MDEDSSLKSSKKENLDEPAETEGGEEDLESKPEQVFDVTADLNMSPVSPDEPKEKESDELPRDFDIEKEFQKQSGIKPPTITAESSTPEATSNEQNKEKIEGEKIVDAPISVPWTPLQTTVPQEAPQTQGNNEEKAPSSDPAKTLVETPEPVNQPERRIPQIDASVAAPVKNIRTFESDVAEVLSHTRTSATSIALAESMKKEGEQKLTTKPETPKIKLASKAPKTMFFLLLSGVLIVGGFISGYYLYSQSPLAPSPSSNIPVQPQTAESIIPADSRVYIPTEGATWPTILRSIRAEIAKDQDAGTIKEIVLTSTSESGRIRVPAKDMAELMDIPVPDILRRSLNTAWMLGVYKDPAGEKNVFVIATNNFFQNAFAGMLQWERLMADDIKQYVRVPRTFISIPQTNMLLASSTIATNTASTTKVASSTAAASSTVAATGTLSGTGTSSASTTAPRASQATYITLRGSFDDRIVGNKDVREFVTTDGGLLFLYSFINNDKLLIADRESTLIEVLVRLEKQAFIR